MPPTAPRLAVRGCVAQATLAVLRASPFPVPVADRAKKKGGGRSTMADTAPNQCCRAADWGMGGFIVVGTNDGKVLVLDEATLETVGEEQVADQAITVVKFDPGCEFVAVGSADSHAYIYRCTVDGALEKVSTCRGNSSYITHLDWDETGLAVQTCSGAYELLYYTAETYVAPRGACVVVVASCSRCCSHCAHRVLVVRRLSCVCVCVQRRARDSRWYPVPRRNMGDMDQHAGLAGAGHLVQVLQGQ